MERRYKAMRVERAGQMPAATATAEIEAEELAKHYQASLPPAETASSAKNNSRPSTTSVLKPPARG